VESHVRVTQEGPGAFLSHSESEPLERAVSSEKCPIATEFCVSLPQ
jgi:hypothetical protein